MAKVRKDLVGTVLAVDQEQHALLLEAGQKIPKGYFVGGHAVEDGDPKDQTPPWKQKGIGGGQSDEGTLEQLVASGASPEEILAAVADHLGVEIATVKAEGSDDETGGDSGAQSGVDGASGSDGGSQDAETLQVPPKGGAGSGADAWRAYAVGAAKAKGLNIEIPEGAGREDIIEALNGAGIATE